MVEFGMLRGHDGKVFSSVKKTGPCDLGDSNGPLRVVKSPRTSEKIVIFGHSKV